MEINPEKLILVVIGLIVSMITYFIRKESKKLQDLGDDVRRLEKELVRNTCKDAERWYWINKNLDNRKQDCKELLTEVHKLKEK